MKNLHNIHEISKLELEPLIKDNINLTTVLKKLGYRSSEHLKNILREKIKDLNISTTHMRSENNYYFLNKCDKSSLKKIVLESKSFADFNKKTNTSKDINYKLKKLFNNYDISISHFIVCDKKDLSNTNWGKWKVIEEVEKKGIHRQWLCECSCGTIKEVLQTHLIQGNSKGCNKCSNIGKESSCFTGYEEISGEKFNMIKKGAIKRGIPFQINITDIWDLFIKQNRLCNLSGLEIYFGKTNKDKTTASLDRIDSNKGYSLDNIQWIHRDINIMKNKFDQKYFINICNMITNRQK